MALASSNRAQVRYLKESAFGVIDTVGTPKDLRVTGESLDFTFQTDTSKELRSDRQTTDVIQVDASAAGAVNIEFSYKEFDQLIEAALQGTWDHFGTNGVSAAGEVTLDSAAGTLTWTVEPTTTSALTNLEVGQWFKLNAGADAANGAYLKVLSRTATVVTVATSTPIPGTGSRAVAGVTISTSTLTNGVTQPSFTVEKEFSDVGQVFTYRGMCVSQMDLNFESGSILTGSINFMGKNAIRGTATAFGAAASASEVFDVMNSVQGVGNVWVDGAPLADTFIRSLSLSINNNLREQKAIANLGAIGIAAGTLAITGNMSIYFADGTLWDGMASNEDYHLSFHVNDGDGNGYVFEILRFKFTSAQTQAGSLDSDVMLDTQYQAIMDKTDLKTIRVTRL
jgi:hypothetical protein